MSPLPSRPNLDRLRRLARTLQRSAVHGDAAALERLMRCFSDVDPKAVKLSQAQLVLARESGFRSWPELVAHVERRVAKVKAAEARRRARAADAHTLAERWFALARAGDYPSLLAALAVGKCRMQNAREVMRRDMVSYDAFLETIIVGTSHPKARVRFECAHHLDTFGDARCQATLVRLMDDPVPRVRWMAMHALSCHACNDASCSNDTAVHARIAHHARHDESVQVRRHATAALGSIESPLALETLHTILQTERDPATLCSARFALSRHRKGTEPAAR